MSALKTRITSSTEATTDFIELSMYGNHIIGYVKDLRDTDSKMTALELDHVQDNLLEKDLKLIILTTSKPSDNEMIRSQLGFKSQIYTVDKADIDKLPIKEDKMLLVLKDKSITELKQKFDSKGIQSIE